MKFLVDAHLPRRLAYQLHKAGHDAIHTLDLPHKNRTTDAEILDISELERRAVISKDADFVNSFLLTQRPYKLLSVSTGNITNAELESLFARYIDSIVIAFETNYYLELSHAGLIVHM